MIALLAGAKLALSNLSFTDWMRIIFRILCVVVIVAVGAMLVDYGKKEQATTDQAAMTAHLKNDADALAARQRQALEDQKAASAQYEADAQAHARETFRRTEIQAQAERVKDEKLASLASRVAFLSRELRSRPERPGGDRAPGAASAGGADPAVPTACTGAQLYRSDAEFLVGEAARAQRILAERDECHDKYDALMAKPEAPK